ncbi:MAG TPA: imidazolonepropionase [Ignavibacteriaceae bacterium]|nr:imidazolonepropionase [Ignavibacteriaceae bacterium]
MLKLLLNPAQIVTVDTKGENFKRGPKLNEINVVTGHSIIIENDIIKDLVPDSSIKNHSLFEIINVKDKTILPGLVECHTHTAFAGSRADEFRMKLAGIHYEEISAKGGGILSTVKAVRESSFEELINIISSRIKYFISQGITTLEIKSGYGLDFDNEIKLLHIINYLNEVFAIDIIPTFLGAHTVPPEYKEKRTGYIDLIINKMIPHIAKNKLAEFCDAFCEKTAYNAGEVDAIFSAAQKSGLGLKLHTEQFNSIGGLNTALQKNAVSVDHLEVLTGNDIVKLAESDTVAVLLPGVSFFLNYGYAPARKLIDAGAVVALATDYNPGSSNIADLNLVMSLACLKMNMTIEETISAVTINAAGALNKNKYVGSIEPGKKADFAVLDTSEYADIVYQVGKNINIMTIKNGNIIFNANGGLN